MASVGMDGGFWILMDIIKLRYYITYYIINLNEYVRRFWQK
jgi:hypothetical protein